MHETIKQQQWRKNKNDYARERSRRLKKLDDCIRPASGYSLHWRFYYAKKLHDSSSLDAMLRTISQTVNRVYQAFGDVIKEQLDIRTLELKRQVLRDRQKKP